MISFAKTMVWFYVHLCICVHVITTCKNTYGCIFIEFSVKCLLLYKD